MMLVMTQPSAPGPDTVELAPRVHALDLGLASLTVEVAPGIELPRYIAPTPVTFDGKPDGVTVWLTVRCHEDGPTCHELLARSESGGVSGEVLRAMPLASLVRGLVWRNLLRVREDGYERYTVPSVSDTDGDDVLRVVADVYRVAAYVGDAPRLAVQHALGVSKTTADRRIREARRSGALDVAAPLGRGGRVYQE